MSRTSARIPGARRSGTSISRSGIQSVRGSSMTRVTRRGSCRKLFSGGVDGLFIGVSYGPRVANTARGPLMSYSPVNGLVPSASPPFSAGKEKARSQLGKRASECDNHTAQPVHTRLSHGPGCLRTAGPPLFVHSPYSRSCGVSRKGEKLHMIKALLSMGLLIGVVACGGATGLKVSQEDFGDEWPFTVPDGELGCEEGAAYTFTHDGTVYALNGMADTWAEVFGYADLDPIWKPRTKPLAPGVPAPSYMRMDVSEMFRLAGEQCEETPATGLKVSQEDFGDDWPFTVPDGTLKCWPELTEGTLAEEGLGWYTFEHGGTTYALNSVLLGTVNGFQGWSDIQLIWKQDLRTTTPGAPNPNIRVNISEMVGLAMKQCS